MSYDNTRKLLNAYGVDSNWYQLPDEKKMSGDCIRIEETPSGQFRCYRFERGIEDEYGQYSSMQIACSVLVAQLLYDRAIVDGKL